MGLVLVLTAVGMQLGLVALPKSMRELILMLVDLMYLEDQSLMEEEL